MAEVSYLEVYLAYHEGDMCIGTYIGASDTKEGAEALAEGKGCWVGNGVVIQRKAIQINTKIYVIDCIVDGVLTIKLNENVEKAKEAIRKKALAKLTPAEREVLGL